MMQSSRASVFSNTVLILGLSVKMEEDAGVASLVSLRRFCSCPPSVQPLLSACSLCKKEKFCPLGTAGSCRFSWRNLNTVDDTNSKVTTEAKCKLVP